MLRIGLVGAGGVALTHAEQLATSEEATIAGVVEPDPERRAGFIERFGGRPFRDVESMLSQVDAAYVLTPPRHRVDIIEQLAAAGKAILCEKPLAASVADGEAIAQIVDRTGVPFMTGFMRRFSAPLRELRAIAQDPRFGRPVQYSRVRMGYLEQRPGNWRVDADERCGMTVESVSHDIDLLRWLAGEDVVAASGEVIESRDDLPGYDDNMVATLRFASGAIGTLQVSWTSRLEYNSCSVTGLGGAALVDGVGMHRSDRLRVRWPDAGDEHETSYPAAEAEDMGYAGETTNFLALARGQRAEGASVEDGLATLRVSHAILAASSGR